MQDGNGKSFTLYDAVDGAVREDLSTAEDLGDLFNEFDGAGGELLENRTSTVTERRSDIIRHNLDPQWSASTALQRAAAREAYGGAVFADARVFDARPELLHSARMCRDGDSSSVGIAGTAGRAVAHAGRLIATLSCDMSSSMSPARTPAVVLLPVQAGGGAPDRRDSQR